MANMHLGYVGVSEEAGGVLNTAAGVHNHAVLAAEVPGASSPSGVPWAAAPEGKVDVVTAAGAASSVLLAPFLELVMGGFSHIVLGVHLEAGDSSGQDNEDDQSKSSHCRIVK